MNDAKKDTQFLEEDASTKKKKVDVSRPTTVVKGNDIYMLAGKYSRTAAAGKDAQGRGAGDSGLLLAKGKVSEGDSDSNKKIQWNVNQRLVDTLFKREQDSLMQLVAGGGSGVKMHDDTLVLPVEVTKKSESENDGETKSVSLLIYTSDTSDYSSWKLSKGMSDGGCSNPSVVEWGEKDGKLMMMTACDDGRRRVYESGDKGESWTEALGTLSRVWGNKHEEQTKRVASGFTTATLGDDNKKVVLVTLPVYSKEKGSENKEKSELHLWLTDNTRIVDIGPVSEKDEDEVAASSLLYESAEDEDNNNEDKLIALYEKKKGDEKPSHSLWSVRLTEQLKRVKEVLATWKEADKRVSKLCPSLIAEKDRSTVDVCSADVKITDGLVGFLSDSFSDNTWRDEYLGVNATVNHNGGAEKAKDGVNFRGAWAEWPVGKQGENQLYHFANYNFTLVATVSIHGVPKEGTTIPLMGVKMSGDGNPVLLGLSYDNNNEKKWILLYDGRENKELKSTSETERTHQVAIVLQNEKQGSAYVDGQRVGNEECALVNKGSKEISHFYIGGDGGSAEGQEGFSVTVSNVLLYNRPLTSAEIGALNPNKAPIPPAVPGIVQGTLLQSPDGQPLSDLKLLNEDEGVGGGGASPSAVSASTTSSGSGQSVIQLAPGKPPDGNADEDGAFSSSGNRTVGERSADTMQGDGPHKPSVGNTAATADTNVLTAKGEGHDGPALTADVSASSGENGETAEGKDEQGEEGIHPQDRDVNATPLNNSLVNLSQGNNSDAGSVCGSGLLPLLLLLGLWGFAAL
ncbi:putative trans-sialidase [Trypanosoma cruzi]|nr:putative trans-sialidase [Trypanosoma cruzi]